MQENHEYGASLGPLTMSQKQTEMKQIQSVQPVVHNTVRNTRGYLSHSELPNWILLEGCSAS